MKDNYIDVLILQFHTSNFTKPLDLCLNGAFKRYLSELNKFQRTKKEMENNFSGYIRKICDCIHKALNPEGIKKDFYKSMIPNPENDILRLEETIYAFIDSLPEISSTTSV
jgi:vacuolar-type H+-ATPase subunit C/Vma6